MTELQCENLSLRADLAAAKADVQLERKKVASLLQFIEYLERRASEPQPYQKNLVVIHNKMGGV